jgi:hypothetical protein
VAAAAMLRTHDDEDVVIFNPLGKPTEIATGRCMKMCCCITSF